MTLESILNESSNAVYRLSAGLPDSATVLVNRVSDAASPSIVKAFVAFLYLCTIPVVNGADAYALCSNKWCHHELFFRAGLSTPRTRKFFQPDIETIRTAVEAWENPSVQRFLLKPNAGGFGQGIIQYRRGDSLTELPKYLDGMVLLQEYHDAAQIYRIWFLNGRVLCGTVRTDTTSFNGCAASSAAEAYDVPSEVCAEIEDSLLPLLPNVLTGSVEFLIRDDDERLYFDLNLLSTFPLDRQDAWDAFASCILARSCSGGLPS